MGKTRNSYQLTTSKKQRGISVMGAVIIIMIIAGIATFGISAAPMYINHLTVMEIARDVAADKDLKNKPSRFIKSSINKRFRTNNLWDLDSSEVIQISREKGKGLLLTVDYEVRRPLIYNMELVAHFSETSIGLN